MDAKTPHTKPALKVTEPIGLVGRYFHIWDAEGYISRQGRVIAQIDPTHYLVQFYEWFVGEASTLHIYTLDTMTTPRPEEDHGLGAWQFYEDAEHWRFWFEHRAPRRP
jgi:hypothetical protein